MDTLTYQDRCQLAATAQGLDPIVEALNAADIWVDVAQTGGFCMVAVVPCTDGVVAIIDDGGEYVIGAHPGTTWEDGEGFSVAYSTEIRTLDAMVSRVRSDAATLGGVK